MVAQIAFSDVSSATGTGPPATTISAIINLGRSPSPKLLIIAAASQALATVTNFTFDSGATAVFNKAAEMSGTNAHIEIWTGRAIVGSTPGDRLRIAFSQPIGSVAMVYYQFEVSGDIMNSAITATASSGNSGTSTSVDTNTVTPAVGDLLVSAYATLTTATVSARTYTGNSLSWTKFSSNTPSGNIELDINQASTAASTKEVITLSQSTEWAAVNCKLVLPADATPAAALPLRGLLTAATDLASTR